MADSKQKDKAKKQIPLRLSASLYEDLAQWAEDDFRSVNGQIEYLLTECVRKRKGKKDRKKYERGGGPVLFRIFFCSFTAMPQ